MIILEFIHKGGIFMWPLFLVAILAFYLVIYKGVYLLKLYFRYRKNMDIIRIRECLKEKRYDDAKALVKGNGPVEKILAKGIVYLTSGFDEVAIKDRLEMIYEEEVHNLEKGLSIILVLAEIMPMLGLLGTVSGMIQVFRAISVYGTGDAQALASGISEALLTTETGLVLAIPTMFLYALLNGQVDKITRLMNQAGSTVVTSLRVLKKKEAGLV